eukprot:CAMPEP_0170072992 /NCGR_PEP_ID=MMETSP0019_2-20121128/10492_1 /TAXON_ID=98059 /ORGANISM="Dinobryon sp., Strain UTEXLB2267" /LENGTH=235 /DNA_ID=CAMNT_0010282241 /DNA_START=60 /DNA_END=767 /DNA_ORIENTATION=+
MNPKNRISFPLHIEMSNQIIDPRDSSYSVTERQILELRKLLQMWKSGAIVAKPTDYDRALDLVNQLHSLRCIEEEEKSKMIKDISELKQSVARLEGTVVSLQGEIEEMKVEIEEMKVEKEFSKYLVALQDMNSLYGLEKVMENHLSKKNFAKLRQKRNSQSHYIIGNECDDLKAYKAVSIRDRLNTMSPACAAKFTKGFGPSFINAVKNHFSTFVATGQIAEVDKELADEWWTDL